jgi:hypothetical protein
MSHEAKKNWETRYLEKVKSLYPAFPQGTIIPHEEPDFLISNAEDRVGIEMVQYVRGQSKRGSRTRWHEELHDEIVDLAKAKFEAQSAIPLSVHLHWFHHQELRGDDAHWISEELNRLVGNYEAIEINEGVSFEPDYREKVSDFIAHVSIRRRTSGKSVWSSVEVGPAEASGSEVRDLISAKNLKVKSYLRHCTKIWLVIVADGQRISSSGGLNDRDRLLRFESEFDKLLYYDGDTKSLFELAKM